MPGPTSAHGDEPLHQQVAHLRLLERAATAANQAASLEEAVAPVLAEVCAYTGWPVGHLYVAGPVPGVLLPSATWYFADEERFAEFRDMTLATPMEAGSGLPGRILVSGRPEWIEDIRLDANTRAAAGDVRVRAAFGVPVQVGDEVVAVLEFFAEQPAPRDDALLDLLSHVGHQLARVVERSRATAALRQSEERYRALTQSAQDAIITVDAAGLVMSFNTGAERAFGYREDEVVGGPLSHLMPARLREAHEAALARLRAGGMARLFGHPVEFAGLRRDGTEFPLELSLSTWETTEGRFYSGIIRDITERRQAEEDRQRFEQQLTQRSLHDGLTGLPNRALLFDRVEQALARATRTGEAVSLLAINLDRFKGVNDTYGHQKADQLLVAVAARLQAVAGPGDTVARIGGDEFALLTEGDPELALKLGHEVTAAFFHPVLVDEIEVTSSASVGAAIGRGGETDAEQLLRDAVVAIELARRRGPGHLALFDDSMRAGVSERREVAHDLQLALRDGELRLYYQPIVDVTAERVAGVEALVRWEHPSRGLLLPQQFIGLAEDSGLIVPLGRWVLEEACRQAARWRRNGARTETVRVAVNVSARQFQQPHWVDEVARALLTSGADPAQLVLEITESVLMEDTDTTSRRLGELRDLGVRVAIDDFGTGYSSLGYLRQFPVDILKVDKSFIDGVAEGPHESALARAVIKLAATLHLDAVAEGVTNRRQLAMLRRLRCRFAQGYYFARPLPLAAVNALLSRRGPVVEAVADPLPAGEPSVT